VVLRNPTIVGYEFTATVTILRCPDTATDTEIL